MKTKAKIHIIEEIIEKIESRNPFETFICIAYGDLNGIYLNEVEEQMYREFLEMYEMILEVGKRSNPAYQFNDSWSGMENDESKLIVFNTLRINELNKLKNTLKS